MSFGEIDHTVDGEGVVRVILKGDGRCDILGVVGELDGHISGDGHVPVDDGDGGTKEEFILLSLRTKNGLDFADYQARFHEKLPQAFFMAAKNKIPPACIHLTEQSLSLTEKGFLLENEILAELLSAMPEEKSFHI